MLVDSDMTMPPHTITTLLEHNLDIVGCHYVKRDGSGDVVGEQPVKPLPGNIVRVPYLGTGMLMINIDVFKKMSEPWFNVSFRKDKWISEDQAFCALAKKSGYNIHCDLDLSQEIGHIGRTVFKS